ncbi:MAG: hypothetical protein WC088_01210 [Candidatus Izemoplasmatales bacterium]|nr:hypothetical protein [Candidatus Izemoplasmatales bacterium]MDD4595779.1 hypothetical protein [Candidatus Izemoplasmatales bacterium]
MKKFWNVLGQIFGFLTIALFAFWYTNEQFSFITDTAILGILLIIKDFAALAVAAIVGMEFVSGKKLFVLLYLIILAIVVIFIFYPDLGIDISNYIKSLIQ